MSASVQDTGKVLAGRFDRGSTTTKDDPLVLSTGGDDGSGGRMEGRVAKLESDVQHIRSDIGDIKTVLNRVDDRIEKIGSRIDAVKDAVHAAKDDLNKSIVTVKDKVHSNTLWIITAFVGVTALAITIAKIIGVLATVAAS